MKETGANQIIIILLLMPCLAGFVESGYNKSTKKDELIFISTEQEKIMGANVARQVDKRFKEVDDPLVQKRIEDIGGKIGNACERKDVIYRFKVLKSEEKDNYNAFSLPGGYVYIFDTLLGKLKSDDDIAAILAHEVAHVAAKHSIKQLQTAMGVNALMILGIGMQTDGRTFATAGEALTQLMMSYSREAEVDADALSVKYLKDAGYNPDSVLNALLMLRELRKKSPIRTYMYYRSHPYLSERIARVKSEIKGSMDFESYINIPKDESF